MVLSRILQLDRDGIIILSNGYPFCRSHLARLHRVIGADNITRVRWIPAVDKAVFLNLVAVSDVVLDPFPFGGCNTTFEAFDYKATDKMLSRLFMTRLRYAFVSGKYAIGIAAVNQTNHSLNQRQPIYIDKNRLDLVPKEDLTWLGDCEIKFEEYNSMTMNGKKVPVLSMIKNKSGEFISDLIGQFIDGYVDIAKGPWIMELGAAPNVTSTW